MMGHPNENVQHIACWVATKERGQDQSEHRLIACALHNSGGWHSHRLGCNGAPWSCTKLQSWVGQGITTWRIYKWSQDIIKLRGESKPEEEHRARIALWEKCWGQKRISISKDLKELSSIIN